VHRGAFFANHVVNIQPVGQGICDGYLVSCSSIIAQADRLELSWTCEGLKTTVQLRCNGLDWLIPPLVNVAHSERFVALPVRFSDNFATVFYSGDPLSDESSLELTPGQSVTMVTQAHRTDTGIVRPPQTLVTKLSSPNATGSPILSLPALIGVAGAVVTPRGLPAMKLLNWSDFREFLNDQESEILHIVCHYLQPEETEV
jgi:hypothetical protein